jgi:SprT protein
MCFEENIMEDQHIRSWIRFACDCNKVPELAQVILVEWNPRFTRRLGDAAYNSVTFRARIRLSSPLWPRTSSDDQRETVIHETCHIIVGYQHGFAAAAHGAEWKQAMKNCGVEPLRLHTIDRTGLARKQKRFILLDCPRQGAERKCRCSIREYNKLRRGVEMWCKVCGLHLDRESAVEVDRTASLKV